MATIARVIVSVLALVASLPLGTVAQAGDALGSVRIPVRVMADGQPLAAGPYTLRLSSEAVRRVPGQGPDSEKWVEFLQGGVVKGRELASVVAPADVKAMDLGTPPASGRAVVQNLRGSEYLRVWANRDGTHYLVHLRTAR